MTEELRLVAVLEALAEAWANRRGGRTSADLRAAAALLAARDPQPVGPPPRTWAAWWRDLVDLPRIRP